MNPKIDPEFKNLIPPLTPDEYGQLESNLLADGCLDSIKLWGGTILDGHNRFAICTAHGLTYRTEDIQLDSREDAVIWICKNQMGRRNVTDEQKSYLIGKQYEAEKKLVGQHMGNQYTQLESGQNVQTPNRRETKDGTSGRIGKEYGIDGKTVRRNEGFAKGLDAIGENDPALKQDILSGKTSVTKQDVSNVILLPVPDRPAAIEKIKRGERLSEQKPKYTVDDLFKSNTPERDVNSVTREIVNLSQEFMGTLDRIIDMDMDLIDTDPQKIINALSEIETQIKERIEKFK